MQMSNKIASIVLQVYFIFKHSCCGHANYCICNRLMRHVVFETVIELLQYISIWRHVDVHIVVTGVSKGHTADASVEYIQSWHARPCKDANTHTHACTHTYIHTGTHTYSHTDRQAHIPTYTQRHTHTLTHTHSHTHKTRTDMHARTHARTHAHAHTHTHTQCS